MSNNVQQIETPRSALCWFQFRLRSLLLAALGVALFFGTNGFGVVGLHYPRALENDPLLAPIRVVSSKNDTLELEDGRVLCVSQSLAVEPLAKLLVDSGNRVDVETEGEETYLFVKRRGWICGTGWVRPLNIRLIPDDVPINHRESIAIVTVKSRQSKASGSPTHTGRTNVLISLREMWDISRSEMSTLTGKLFPAARPRTK